MKSSSSVHISRPLVNIFSMLTELFDALHTNEVHACINEAAYSSIKSRIIIEKNEIPMYYFIKVDLQCIYTDLFTCYIFSGGDSVENAK